MSQTPKDESIDWAFWRLRENVKDWEAAALSIGLNPDHLKHSPHSWMSPGSSAIFESGSFKNEVQRTEFSKRRRLAETYGKEHGDKVKYYHTNQISLMGFARWLHQNDMTIPPELHPPSGVDKHDIAVEVRAGKPKSTVPSADIAAARGKNTTEMWQAEARRVANALHIKDRTGGAHSSVRDIGERVAEDFRARGIEGASGPLSGASIVREALQGGRWKRPVS